MIFIKTLEEIEIMAEGGRILAKVMRELKAKSLPGITTKELDKLAEELIFSYGTKPAFKGYNNFPAALCVSINEQIVHGVPSNRALLEGDILSLDLGLVHKGLCLDMAVTLPIGSISPETGRLIRTVKKALKRAIVRVKVGKTLGDVGHAIQKHIEDQDFQVIKDLCGHGIGKQVHEKPDVLNFGKRHKGEDLKIGMVLAIEPMATMGRPGIKKGPDGFCYQTADNSLSVHFEHTIAVTEKGPRVLTK